MIAEVFKWIAMWALFFAFLFFAMHFEAIF